MKVLFVCVSVIDFSLSGIDASLYTAWGNVYRHASLKANKKYITNSSNTHKHTHREKKKSIFSLSRKYILRGMGFEG